MLFLFIDEVGYGSLAGPVLVCGLLSDSVNYESWDSKRFSKSRREAIFKQIRSKYFVYWVPAYEIDRLGIRPATNMAMLRVINALGPVDKIYIDGICGPKLDQCHEFVKDGDNIIKEIGLASICAKVSRDNFMVQLAKKYPKYGWDTNMGYGTPAHIEAIKLGGLTEYHRRSYVKMIAPI